MADSTLDTSLPLPALSPAERPVARSAAASGAWHAAWCGADAWAPYLSQWRDGLARYAPDDFGANPDWCQATEAIYPGALRLLLLRRHRELAAVVPILVKTQSVDCHLGELRVLRFRPRMVQLAGAEPALPDEPGVYAAFLQALLDHPDAPAFDLLRFSLPVESAFWRFLAAQDFARLRLRCYQPAPPVPHHLIQLAPNFAAYAAKFTPKTRKNRARELKYLEQRGAVELIEYRRPDQVEEFLAAAAALSNRSYQHKLLKAGLHAPAQLRRRVQVAAAQGWLRSYVLRCAGVNCSYMLGYQYHHRYLYTKVGYDPAWAKLCVGTVLQWLVLQDLYRRDTPAQFDFGPNGPQKQYFGNASFLEGEMLIFRHGPYGALVHASHHSSRRLTVRASSVLHRLQLKPQAQRLLRRLRGC